ncbi:MAG TPA: hypothetical protein VIT92_09650 [Burkholderiaceae bacterium]
MHEPQDPQTGPAPERITWTPWEPLLDLDVWIANHDRELAEVVVKNATGYGTCFRLLHGGDIYMHTTSEGDVLLDITPEAAWASPVVTAATGVDAPRGQFWALPGEAMMPLLMGLSSLIEATRVVAQHDFRIRKNLSW